MMHRITSAAVLALMTAVAAWAGPPVTLVLRNGERTSGSLVYHNDNNINLNINGQERAFPQSEIAIIAFVPGDPGDGEINQLERGNAELRRNMIVMRDGSILHGKVYTFGNDANTVTVDVDTGGRRDISAYDIARVYMNGGAARRVYRVVTPPTQTPVATSGALPSNAARSTIIVPGSQHWIATGMRVLSGEALNFRASGEVQFTGDPSDRAQAAGSFAQKRVAGAPLPNAFAGALIGRIDNGQPFAIGDQPSVRMPASGQLFLGINDDNVSDNSGAFTVTISR